jgi:YD repeat-containing protein
VGEAGYNAIDLADYGITGEVLQLRIVGVSSDDPDFVYALTAIQVKTGDFRSTRNVYDGNGNLIQTIDALGNSEVRTVDRYGRVTSITDRGSFTTRFEYAQLIAAPTKVINPDESFRTFTYNQFDHPTSIKNELGHETKIDYNR